jgi:non-homologous end joining protein Ku
MGATLKNVNITLGLVNLSAKVKTAVGDPDTKLNIVCVGHAGDGLKKGDAVEHPPTRVKTQASTSGGGWLVCPTCLNTDRDSFGRGKEVGGLTVLVPQSELDKFLASDEVKKTIALTAHETVELADAMPSGKVYWIDVDPPVRKTYATFVRLLQDRPDISYIAEFAVRSLTALYKLDVVQNALCIRELAWPEFIEPAPQVDLSLVDAKDLKMAIAIAETGIVPFDVADYRNQRAENLAAFLASAEGTEGIGATTTPAVKKSGVDLSSQLEAALAAAKASKVKRTATTTKTLKKKAS